ncbi:Protein osiris 12 [Camponotus japonicus]
MPAIKNLSKCVLLLLVCSATIHADEDDGFLERGYRALYRVYEECEHRNLAISPCLKKKAITFFERLGRIQTLPIGDNLELVRVASLANDSSKGVDLEKTLARTSGGATDESLNDILFERIAALLNSFNVQISLPKTTSGDLKRSVEEGRGKMKKMMGMMMMGMAMKLAALVPIAIGVLFLLAGKALIISKIALVLSLIIGLKKLLSQKQSHDHGGWQQGGGGWDRSLKGIASTPIPLMTEADRQYAQTLAYGARMQH